jgi:hypothetical protein
MRAIYECVWRDKRSDEVSDRFRICREASTAGFLWVANWGAERAEKTEYLSEIIVIAQETR